MSILKKALSALVVMVLVVCVCMASLVISAYLPQGKIHANVQSSTYFLLEEGDTPAVGDRSSSSVLDNFTDYLILEESDLLDEKSLGNLLRCPDYYILSEGSRAEKADAYFSADKNGLRQLDYTHYWMGFRAPMRALLTFFDWQDIRRLIAFGVLALATLAACSIGTHARKKYALAFVLSILLVKPTVLCQNVTLSCCFLLAFLSMLCVPRLYRKHPFSLVFFLVVGMLTQFFDFYTTPVITLCYPLLYLLLLMVRDKVPASKLLAHALKAAGVWLAGYAFMWVSKLVLTAVFTNGGALFEGFGAFLSRVGLASDELFVKIYPIYEGMDFSFKVSDALSAVLKSVGGSWKWLYVYGCALVLLAAYALIGISRKKFALRKPNLSSAVFGLIALFPIIWFCVSAQPTIQHAWFQYRSVSVFYFGLFCAVLNCFRSTKKRPRSH